jgi:hypothetical protein
MDFENLIAPLIGGLILCGVIAAIVRVPGLRLQRKFARIGTLKGQRKSVVFALAGPPNAISALPDGKTLCQWQATGYHIALVFNQETCEGVSHVAAT